MRGNIRFGHLMKLAGVLACVAAFMFLFVRPEGDSPSKLFSKKKGVSEELQVLGDISRRNPRVKELQEILKEAGFQPGPIDGEMGPRTRAAIREFQKKEGWMPSGIVDFETWTEVSRQKTQLGSISEITPESETLAEVQSASSLMDEQTELKAEEITKKANVQDEVMGYRLRSKERVKKIQMALKRAGFDPGGIDGEMGPKTKQAITAFQRSRGLRPDGVIGEKTLRELRPYLEEEAGT